MELKFLSLTVKNFGSFIEEQTFDFSKLAHGAYFIRGENTINRKLASNGSGKSTFFINALCWVLTGKTPVGLRSTDIKPWKVPKGKRDNKTTVTLNFSIDDKTYELKRVAPNAITLDENEVSQEHIDKLTRLSFPILKQTVLFGQHEPLFFDLSNKDKLAILSEVLNLDKWDIRSQKASERARALEIKLTKLEAELAGHRVGLKSLEESIEDTRKASKRWKTEKAERIERLRQQRKELKAEEDELTKQLNTATRIAKAAAEKLGEYQGNHQIALGRLREIENEYMKIYEQQKFLQRQIKEVETELEDLGQADTCPTCGQPITGTDLGKHKKELKKKLQKLTDELKELKNKKFNEAIEKEKEHIIRLKASVSHHQAEYDSTKREVEKASRRVTEIQALRAGLVTQINERKEETNPHIDQLKRLREKATELEEKVEVTETEIKKNRERYERAKFWIKGFKDVRLFIIEDVLQELELTTNSILADLGLSDWSVSYDIERETKSGTLQTGLIITILSSTNDKPVRWEVWSGGEGQRLRLAGSLALSEVLLNYAGVNIDLEVFDEPTKHMNSGGVDDFCDLLASRAEDLKRHIFLIDHTAIESSAFVDSIKVVKDDKGSHIEQD